MNTKRTRSAKSLIYSVSLGLALIVTSTSCTTTYDRYGQPVQSVDPGAALVGAAAAGVLGYAIANNRSDNRYQAYHHNGYDHPHYGRHYQQQYPQHVRRYYR